MSLPSKRNGITHYRHRIEQRRIQREHALLNKLEGPIDSDVQRTTSVQGSMSTEEEYDIEKYLVEILSDPLVDLPLNSQDVLSKVRKHFKNTHISEDFLNILLAKFSATFKLIK
jgi:hypothetical protein